MQASRVFIPLAERGNPSAQAYLGFMFETGRGVPQNYTEAAMWYRRAAEQGDSLAQYSLGLLYDQGLGVPRDIVEANKWLNLVDRRRAPPGTGSARAYSRCGDHQDDARRDRACPLAGAGMGADPGALESVSARQRCGPVDRVSRITSASASQPSQIAGARNSPKGRKAVALSGRLRIAPVRK